ncbi:transcriptional regulator GcvA [Pigmentiphaga sp. GD03639]|uniref:Transcriptional regulator GcvA n=1 Tax=Pigmentiphaga daeguensis TaxID=414049 RepID=A0ABN1CEK4_9BURK|nr:transcriptional regulator GcvA [Pigmentiphaga sp. GD03639]MDH2236346.1 transcriptional regulator GcvA [Pigmentiphaga sp. GD03639]
MRRLPPLNAIRAFEAAARHLSFTKAASELCVTHGAVSRQVAALEHHLGLQLFRRLNHQIQLTDEGRTLLAEVGPALDRIALSTYALTRKAGRVVLSINAPPTFTMKWLIPRMSGFQRRHPEVELRLTTSIAPVESMALPELDAVIRRLPAPLARFDSREFLRTNLVAVCAPEILERASIRGSQDLARHTLINASTHPHAWEQWFAAAGLEAITPGGLLMFEEMYFALQAAVDGLGIALVPEPLAVDDIAAGRLAAPLGAPRVYDPSYYLIASPHTTHRALLDDFTEWLCEQGDESDRLCVEVLGQRHRR